MIGSATRIETLMAQTQSRASAPEPTDAAAEYLMTIRYMHAEAQPVIAARLAERLGVSAATVSEMVTRLVREGLLAVDGVVSSNCGNAIGDPAPPADAIGCQ